MAHKKLPTIQLPTSIEFLKRPVMWVSGKAKPTKVYADGDKEIVLRVVEPIKYAGIEISLDPAAITDKPMRDGEVLICDLAPGATESYWPQMNGWKMREDFLRLDGTTTSLLDFLNQYGEWDANYNPEFKSEPSNWRPYALVPDLIWYVPDRDKPESLKLQPLKKVITAGLTRNAQLWFSSNYISQTLAGRIRPNFPHFVITEWSCEEIIKITITIDRIRETEFRLCARPDCDNIFAVESNHERSYCRQYCAHIESVRRSRKTNRKRREKP